MKIDDITLQLSDSTTVALQLSDSINNGGAGTNDYTDLINKPKLDGVTIVGNIHETDPTVPDWAKAQTRPTYTASDVGAIAEGEIEDIPLTTLEHMWNTL